MEKKPHPAKGKPQKQAKKHAGEDKRKLKKRRGKQPGAGYSKEAVYFWFCEADGNVAKAIEIAQKMGATDVPKTRDTWYNCINRNDFAGMLAKEREEYYKRFHLRREKKRQHMLDQVAYAAEPIFEAFGIVTNKIADALKEEVILDAEGNQIDPFRALRDVLSVDGFDKIFRMYLRAMGLPEKITHQHIDSRSTTIMTYEDIQRQKQNAIQGEVILTPTSAQEAAEMAKQVILEGDEWQDHEEPVKSKKA